MTAENSGSFDALRCATKSTMPPSYLNTCSVGGSARSSRKVISRTPVQERHLAEALEQRLRPELELLHDRAVGPERDGRAVTVGVADALQRRDGLAAVDEGLRPPAAVALDVELEAAGEAR